MTTGGPHRQNRQRAATRTFSVLVAWLAVSGFGASPAGAAQALGPPAQLAELNAAAELSGDGFGGSVALSSDLKTALVGAAGTNAATGAAYIFSRSLLAWVEGARLTAGDGEAGDQFGNAVAFDPDGDTAFVAADRQRHGLGDHGVGAVYVFTRSGSSWTQAAELTGSDSAHGDEFGASIAVPGEGTLIIGAPFANRGTGAVYVFTGSGATWNQRAELIARDAVGGSHGDAFGTSVGAIPLNAIVIGAPDKRNFAGAAYVFAGSGSNWTQQAELTAGDAAPGDRFGTAVALAPGNAALVGAPFKNSLTGAAYVFVSHGSTWTAQAELTAADGSPGDLFGAALALGGDNSALIGARGRNNNAGAAYLFTGPLAWTQRAELTAFDATGGFPGDLFGWSVSPGSVNTTLIGAIGKNAQAGAAYVFVR